MYLSIAVLWITLGLLVSPYQFSSIVCWIYGLIGVCIRYVLRELLVLKRVHMSLEHQTTKMVEKQNRLAGQNFSEALLRRMIKQQIEKHLRAMGMARQHIARMTVCIALAQAILAAFLQIGFNAFTNTRDLYYGLINFAISIVCLAAVDSAVNGRRDASIVRDRIVDVVAGVRMDTEKELRFVMQQIKLGVELILADRARRAAEDLSSDDEEDLIKRAEEDEAKKREIMERKRARSEGRSSYMMSQAVARQLVIADKFQTFDTSRIWTQVPREHDDLSDQFSWADSDSTRGTTVVSSEGFSRPSSITGSHSRRSRSRRGSRRGSQRGTPSHAGSVSSGGARKPRFLGEGADLEPAARAVGPDGFNADEELVVLVLEYEGDGSNVGKRDEDQEVLDDFWGKGLAEEKVDLDVVAKVADALGCDPSRLRIEWSRITDREARGGRGHVLDGASHDGGEIIEMEEEDDEFADVGMDGVSTTRQE